MYNNFEGGNHAVELSKRGSGKAHPYNSTVITPNGIKKWGELQIGDYVFGDDGNPTKIIDIPFDGIAPIYKITLKDGRTVEASEGHLWKVFVHNRKNIQILTTKELLDIYKAKRKISYRNPSGVEFRCGIVRNEGIELPYKDTPIDPYTLGLLLGDGCFCTPKATNSLYYTCQDKDAEYIIPKIPYKVTKRKDRYAYSVWINNGANILTSLGLWMHKSENKFIPKEYLFNSKEVRLNLIRGLIDSDGYISNPSHPHNGYEISVSSKKFAEDIQWICRSVGYNADIHVKHPWYYNKNREKVAGLTSYRVCIHTEDTLSNLPRKKNICSKSAYSKSHQLYTRIVDIEYIGEKQAKCITVDNNSHC
jgi:intein/homing endonuclease